MSIRSTGRGSAEAGGGAALRFNTSPGQQLKHRAPGAQALLQRSFLMATAHGAGLMLVPIALGLCAGEASQHGHLAIGTSLTIALLMALVHTAVMITCGLALAWAVYRWLGLGFLNRGWFNLETVWALSLVVTGVVAAGLAWMAPHDVG